MDKEKVIKAIRSILISFPHDNITLDKLQDDYYGVLGTRIPFQQFGFKKLEEFLKSEDSLTLSTHNGKIIVKAKVIAKSAHIVDLVSKQKTDTRKLLRRAYRPTTNWRPKYFRQNRRNYEQSPRLAAVAHNQFINHPSYDKPKVPSKVVIPESSALYGRQNSQTKKVDIKSRLQINVTTNNEGAASHISPTESIESVSTNKSSSPLASTRKRIMKKMSEINLDRDSGNSSPTDETTAEMAREKLEKSFKTTKFVETGDPLIDLNNLVEHFKLGKVETSSKPLKTKRNRFVTCVMKVGNESYHSYPKEFNTPLEAEKYCAQLALQDLISKYNKEEPLLIAGTKDILEKIPSMLEKHTHGMWVKQLELDYVDRYKEKLPRDWLKIIDTSPNIQLENNGCLIRYCRPGGKIFSNLNNNFTVPSEVSIPSNTVQPGDDGKINAQIVCVMSTNEIWCRQYTTEESDTYCDMIVKMEAFYTRNNDNLKPQIVVGGYYVARYQTVWYRIKVIEEYDSEVLCFFIDFGDELKISKDNIFQLKREFALCQAQAFVCRLVGLEDLYEISQNSDSFQLLLYKQVVLELETNEEDEMTLPVFMYSSEDGKSINEEMISLLTLETTPLFEKDSLADVYVSNVESNGDIYVQYQSLGFKTLQKLLLELENQILDNQKLDLVKPVTKENSQEKIYLIRDKIDKHFRRIKIIDWAPTGQYAQIYFIDIGKTQIIDVDKEILYPIESLSDILNQYPDQALKVNMIFDNINNISEDFVKITEKLLDQKVLMKVTDCKDGIPLAEFYKRDDDGTLFCINKSISYESELKKKSTSSIASRISKRNYKEITLNKNVPSCGKLPPPELPDIGDYFGVYVPLAVNPFNFCIQPLTSSSSLNGMMKKLQDFYKDFQYSPLQADQVIPGNIYVSKHEDGQWYRTSVIKVINLGSISVCLCDFGYYTNLTIQHLFPLDPQFMDLPYQTVKAKLAGIKPKYVNWTVNDAEYFKTLVEKKQFYSKLLAIEQDELYESDMVLSLSLLDTSSDEDVFITKELVNKNIAVEEE